MTHYLGLFVKFATDKRHNRVYRKKTQTINYTKI